MRRYERVYLSRFSTETDLVSQVPGNEESDPRKTNNASEDDTPSSPSAHIITPISSRPPSFSSLDPLDEQNQRHELAASFEPDNDDDDGENADEQTQLHRRSSTDTILSNQNAHSLLPVPSPFEEHTPTSSPSRYMPRPVTDGVFANLSAKPDNLDDEKYDEPLPSYETAAADAAPPYWETTIITPGIDSDEVYVDGFPVGNFFAFVWNAMISMSFQFVGFLLTYLLASSHAARNGSRAGLGVILIQYGFYLRDTQGMPDQVVLPDPQDGGDPNGPPMPSDDIPQDSFPKAQWMSYLLMVVGWFILIRSIGEYYRVKQLEKAVRATPTAVGAAPAVVAEGEGEAAV